MNIYHRLTISAKDPDTRITLIDDEGHYITTSTGTVNVSLRRGRYLYYYGRDGRVRPVLLDDDINIEQARSSEEPETSRQAVDGVSYLSPSRDCSENECPGRQEWHPDHPNTFLCDTCEEEATIPSSGVILLETLLRQFHKDKKEDSKNGR